MHYLGRTADRGSNAGFADMLSYPLYQWQSSGLDSTIKSWCSHLGAEEPPPKRELWGKFYSDRWASWPNFKMLVNSYNAFGHCEGQDRSDSAEVNCMVDQRFSGGLGISWTWQWVIQPVRRNN